MLPRANNISWQKLRNSSQDKYVCRIIKHSITVAKRRNYGKYIWPASWYFETIICLPYIMYLNYRRMTDWIQNFKGFIK
jgi:hypothetical protein